MAESPSQTLMDCMDQFGEAEPESVLVIWSTEGDLRSARSGDAFNALGLMEAMKAGILNGVKAE